MKYIVIEKLANLLLRWQVQLLFAVTPRAVAQDDGKVAGGLQQSSSTPTSRSKLYVVMYYICVFLNLTFQ